MVIREDLLIAFGADTVKLKKNELLFREDASPVHYFQIRKGRIKFTNLQYEDREFIQSLRLEGEAVGEVFLFSDHCYPVNAVAMEECVLLRLGRSEFFKLLEKDFDQQLNFLRYISEKMRFSYIILNSLKSDDAAGRLLTFLNYLKDSHGRTERYTCKIPYTRKEIASLTGLRVETVIRAFKKMEGEEVIKIIKGRIFY